MQFYLKITLFSKFIFFLSSIVFAQDDGGFSSETAFKTPKVGGQRASESLKAVKWDHNFGFSVGYARGNWSVDKLGPIEGESFKSRAWYAKADYLYLISINETFGYGLGTSFGYYHEEADQGDMLGRVSSYHLPGLRVGLVANITEFFRFLGGVETYLERLDGLTVTTGNDTNSSSETYKMSLSMTPNFDWFVAMDFFYENHWALRVEGHMRRVINISPSKSEGELIGGRLTKNDRWVSVGLVFHRFAT